MTVIIPLIMPPSQSPPPRREIKRNGIVYREVLPGDDDPDPWWQIPLTILATLFVGLFVLLPAVAALGVFLWFPFLDWLMRHANL